MQAINQLSTEALNKVRLIIDDLKIQSFEDEISSLEHLLQNANLHFKFNNKSAAKSLNPAKQSILSMIFREAINNVIKHAHATEVIGELKVHEHQIILKIKDNGVGIENEDASNLKSIKERVDYLNGKLIVQSNNGTLILLKYLEVIYYDILVITEDQLMLRKAMVQLIEMHEEMNVIKDFENGVEALEFIENNEPNVAILDIEIPGLTGLEILSYVRKNNSIQE